MDNIRDEQLVSLCQLEPVHQRWLLANPNQPIWLDITIGIYGEYLSSPSIVVLSSVHKEIVTTVDLEEVLALLRTSEEAKS